MDERYLSHELHLQQHSESLQIKPDAPGDVVALGEGAAPDNASHA